MTAEQIENISGLTDPVLERSLGRGTPQLVQRLLEERKRLLEGLERCCADLESMDTSTNVPSEHRAALAFAEEEA